MATPDLIHSIRQLDDFMTAPGEGVVESLQRMTGDLLILGAGGKMGTSLAILAKRAAEEAGVDKRIFATSRFSEPGVRDSLSEAGIATIRCDLLEEGSLKKLPDAENVIYMVGTKFGSTGNEPRTWATNTFLPGLVARRFQNSRFVLFSTGNVYPFCPVDSVGCKETDLPGPLGEYAQSALGRERVFQYYSRALDCPGVILRLNYAIDLRYGVLLDVALRVCNKMPIDLTMGYVNVIWQGDANSICLRAFELAEVPPLVLNVTGPNTLSIRKIAAAFGEILAIDPIFTGTEADTALLSDASLCKKLLGSPSVSLEQMIAWTANWVKIGGATLGKPTHYETRDGEF